jgi:WXG100 family type VII secretion target
MAQGIVVNPEQLGALKAVFGQESANTQEILTRISQQLDGTEWEGHVADTFRSSWHDQFAPTLRQLMEALETASTDIQSALDRALAADGQA